MIKTLEKARGKTQLQLLQEKLDEERSRATQQHGIGQSELESYKEIQDRLEMRDMEDEYLTDGRDVVDGDLTDSDQEFQSIVEVD